MISKESIDKSGKANAFDDVGKDILLQHPLPVITVLPLFCHKLRKA